MKICILLATDLIYEGSVPTVLALFELGYIGSPPRHSTSAIEPSAPNLLVGRNIFLRRYALSTHGVKESVEAVPPRLLGIGASLGNQ